MLDKAEKDAQDMVDRLSKLRDQISIESSINNEGSNSVIKSIATSDVIVKDIKEILIILHTTMMTEFTESKLKTYMTNSEIIEIIDDLIKQQTLTISTLKEVKDKLKPKPTNVKLDIIKHFLSTYKVPIGVVIIFTFLWILLMINYDATISLIDKLQLKLKV